MTLRSTLAVFVCSLALVPLSNAQQTVLPLWPGVTPEPAQTTAAEVDIATPADALVNPRRISRLTNVTRPTLAVYPPHGHNNGAAALVLPGGGYLLLSWVDEGVDTCQWINSIGMTCLLLKYRVPEKGFYPANFAPLEDAQQAMRLSRAHAAAWHIDPNRIGVVGFSAGANLSVLLSTHPDDHHVESTPAASEVNATIDARPNFDIVIYPAYLGIEPALKELDPAYIPTHFTPPTFLLQTEDDTRYGKNAPLYYQALAAAKVPAELHLYATGGHGFGMAPVGKPEEHWTKIADTWLRSIGMIPMLPARTPAPASLSPTPAASPCPDAPNPNQPCDNTTPHS